MKQVEIFYVTTNAGKYKEVATFMAQQAPHIKLSQAELDLREEQTDDQRAIALDKVKQAYTALRRPVLVDDSGIYFDKYHQFPGTMSKFLTKGIGIRGVTRLIDPGDKAHFLLYLGYWDGTGEPQLFEGRCDGRLIIPEVYKSDSSLPYNDIFVPEGSDRSYADLYLDLEHKELLSQYLYRLRAAQKFLDWYNGRASGTIL